MANLTLYTMTDPKNVIGKTMNNATPISITLKNDFTFNNPTFELEFDINLAGFNYCHLDFNNYYYFIDSKEVINHRLFLHCRVDGLETLKNDIKNSMAIVTRSNAGSNYIPDSMITNTAEHKIQYRKLGSGFTKESNYIITLAG